MKPAKLYAHLQLHKEYVQKPVSYFEDLKIKFEKTRQTTLSSLFKRTDADKKRGLSASYEMSLLIAKKGKPHTVGEDIILPALKIYNTTVLQRNVDDMSVIPLSNNTVSLRIDEMANNVEQQLVQKLQQKKFTMQIDESTISRSDALLMAYVRYIDDGHFQEEMLMCNKLETTTRAIDIYNTIASYFAHFNIPMTSLISCAADGAPAMLGKRGGCLKLLQDNNPEMKIVHCVIHRENLVAKNLSSELHDVLSRVIKCVNVVKSNAKTERLLTKFCDDMGSTHKKLLLHTPVRWLSQGRCLDRFVAMYDELREYFTINNYNEFDVLWNQESKSLICYLADFLGKLNILNLSLQGSNKTLLDVKTSIQAFVTRLEVYHKEVGRREFQSFERLAQCNVADHSILIICDHIQAIISDFHYRFSDLENMIVPDWLTQPFLCHIDNAEADLLDELSHLVHDTSAAAIHRAQGTFLWLHHEMTHKYPQLCSKAQLFLLPFPTSYLVECGFAAAVDLVTKKRNKLDITKRGDLRLKLTKMVPEISSLASKHQPQGSH